jgi:hypothetical protein
MVLITPPIPTDPERIDIHEAYNKAGYGEKTTPAVTTAMHRCGRHEHTMAKIVQEAPYSGR